MASVQKRVGKHGTAYRLFYRDPSTGKNTPIPFTDPDEAEYWCGIFNAAGVATALRMLAAELGDQDQGQPPGPTVQDIVEDYLDHHPRLGPGQRGKERRNAIRDIYPHLGMLRADVVTPAAVEKWMAYLASPQRLIRGLAAPLAKKSIENRHGLLSSAFNRAIAHGKLTTNPARGLSIPATAVPAEMCFLTHEEWWIVRNALPEYWRPFVTFLVGTGLRWSEATALLVRDVDVTQGRIRVQRAWKQNEEGRWYVGSPKSAAGQRWVGVAGEVLADLRARVATRAGDEFVFTNRQGNPIRNSSFHSRVWGPAIKAAKEGGLTVTPRPHDLRHTFAAWTLAEVGQEGRSRVTIWELQRLMGHESPNVTDKRYGHLMAGALSNAAAATSAALARAMPPAPAGRAGR